MRSSCKRKYLNVKDEAHANIDDEIYVIELYDIDKISLALK